MMASNSSVPCTQQSVDAMWLSFLTAEGAEVSLPHIASFSPHTAPPAASAASLPALPPLAAAAAAAAPPPAPAPSPGAHQVAGLLPCPPLPGYLHA